MDRQRHLKNSLKTFSECNASCMGVNVDGTRAILAGRRGFLLVDLDDHTHPYKRNFHNHKWEPSVLEWNPSSCSNDLFAMVLNQKVEIWSIKDLSDSPRLVLGRHTRVVSDLNWRASDTENHSQILLTCSMDTSIYLWDLRDHKRPVQTFTTVAGPSQVKWNRKNDYVFASAHDGDVRVWDARKGNIPLVYIAGHLSKIHGLDWSPHKEHCFVTASNDNTVKLWNVNNPKQPKASVSSGSPVWRARYTSFGDGLLTVVVPSLRRDENNVLLWNLYDLSSPVHTFSGHDDVILEFQLRSVDFRGHTEYQLVTWSKDQTLRLSGIPPKIVKACSEHGDRHHHHHHHHHQNRSSIGSTTTASPPYSPTEKSIHPEIRKSISEDQETILHLDNQAVEKPLSLDEKEYDSKHENDNLLLKELQKEFDLININNPIVSFEMLDAQQRICGVAAKIGPHLVKVNISFPKSYPNNIPPNFKFSNDTNVDPEVKTRLMKALLDTANSHVKFNRTCLEPCVRQLVQQIEDFSIRDELFETIVSPPPSLPTFYLRRPENNSYGSYQDPAVPFPRFSGARFCGVDKLVVFTRPAKFTYVNTGSSEVTLRSMSALPAFISNMTVEDSFDTSAFDKDVTGSGIRKKTAGTVIISDVSALLPVHKNIARECIISGKDIGEICRINSNAAKMVGRKDLVRAWSLISMVMEKKLHQNENYDETPWAKHPFGRMLIQSLFDYYSSIRDVQTLALLSCVLLKQIPSNSLSNSPVKTKREYTIGTSFVPDGSYAVKRAKVNLTDNLPQTSPDFPYGIYRSSSMSSAAGSMSPPTVILERSESMEDYKYEFAKNCRLLNPSYGKQYDCYKKAYADILYRWNLLTKRAEILKCTSEIPSPHRGLDVQVKCGSCSQTQRESRCITCKKIIVKCSVCRIGVRGLLSFCVACGHGGHTLHMMEWFERMEVCATGCGCYCLRNGNIFADDEDASIGYFR